MLRELANKMYSPTPYFLGRFISNLIVQLLYPIILILLLFWGLGIEESIDNFFWFTAFSIASNFVFVGQGYFVGIMVNNEDAVKLVNFLFIMFWMTSNGILANQGSMNWFIKFLCKISPMRYTCEGMLRRVIKQVPDYTQNVPPLPISP
jgi:ABC-type polysaccharide/polyol phosphate export permease